MTGQNERRKKKKEQKWRGNKRPSRVGQTRVRCYWASSAGARSLFPPHTVSAGSLPHTAHCTLQQRHIAHCSSELAGFISSASVSVALFFGPSVAPLLAAF